MNRASEDWTLSKGDYVHLTKEIETVKSKNFRLTIWIFLTMLGYLYLLDEVAKLKNNTHHKEAAGVQHKDR